MEVLEWRRRVFGLDLLENNIGDITKWKYYLLRRRPETKDGDFNVEEFITLISGELNDKIGNLINRVLKFIEKNKLNGNVRETSSEMRKSFCRDVNVFFNKYVENMDKIELRSGLESLLDLCQWGNRYIQELPNNKEQRMNGFALCYSVIVLIGHCMTPFLPEGAEKLFSLLGISDHEHFPEEFKFFEFKGFTRKVTPLFSNFTEEEKNNLSKFK